MAYMLGAVISFAHRGGPAVTQCVSVVGDWRGDAFAAAAAAALAWLAKRQQGEEYALPLCRDRARIAGTDPAVRPLARPLEVCSHTRSTCQSGCTPVPADGELAEEILTACRPGIPC